MALFIRGGADVEIGGTSLAQEVPYDLRALLSSHTLYSRSRSRASKAACMSSS